MVRMVGDGFAANDLGDLGQDTGSLCPSADYGTQYAKSRAVPWWVWGLIVVLGAVTPLCHYWTSHCPPATAAFTGLRTCDDAQFRQSMRMFLPDFRSPYVLCTSSYKPNYLPASGLAWILGSVGALGNRLGVDEFFLLGLSNGVCGALYLLAVYLLLREVAPIQANLAFCLHALGGGLAGVTFILSSLLGWRAAPTFEGWFYRFAQQELYSGVTLNPLTMFPRLYYTLSLACLFASIALLHRFLRVGDSRRLAVAGVLASVGTFINVRYGMPLWFLVVLWLLCTPHHSIRRRVAVAASMGAGVVLGSMASALTIAMNPAVMGNQLALYETVWLSSLLIAGVWHVCAAPAPCLQAMRRLPFVPRTLAYALAGWLAAFVVLYVGYDLYSGRVLAPGGFAAVLWSLNKAFAGAAVGLWIAFRGCPFVVTVPFLQAMSRLPLVPRMVAYALVGWLAGFGLLFLGYTVYYGSILAPSSFAAPVWASDKAFIGAAVGVWLVFRGERQGYERTARTDWLALWFLLFLVASIGLFLGGWYLRLTPSRLLILASVPLCVLSAQGIQMLKRRAPLAAYALTAAFVLCGVCSQAVSVSCYLGPLGRHPGRERHPNWQYTTMSGADAACIECLGEGTVFTPVTMTPTFGDIVGLRNNGSIVCGAGSLALAGVPWKGVRVDLARFFAADASDSERRELVEKYAVKYVYCPDTTPVPKEVVTALQRIPWLETVTQAGNGCVLRVTGGSGGQ